MKKIGIAVFAVSVLLFSIVSIGYAQTGSDPFTGSWVIRDAKVGGVVNADDIGCTVTISKEDPYYRVKALDDRCDRVAFSRQGNRLEGDYLANFQYLSSHYQGIPESVLSQATSRIKYHCSIVFDGNGLTVLSDNAKITRTSGGAYVGYEPASGFYEYRLTR